MSTGRARQDGHRAEAAEGTVERARRPEEARPTGESGEPMPQETLGPDGDGRDGAGAHTAARNEEPRHLSARGEASGAHAGQKRQKKRRRTLLRALFELAVLAAAAVFVILRLGNDLGTFGEAFKHLHWHWLLLGVVAEGGSVFCLSWLQARLLREGGADGRVRDLLPVTMAANGVAQSLPAGSLFAEGYSFRQYQRLGADWALAGWAELSAGALEAFGLSTVALLGAIAVGPPLRGQLLPGLAFIFVGAGVAAALFRRTSLLSRLISRVLSLAERHLSDKWCERLSSADRSVSEMTCFRPSTRTWLRSWLVATGNWCLDGVVLISGLLTVGAPVPWRALLLCYAAAQLLVELPITPGGLGIVEGGLAELLTRFHLTVTQATAGTLMYRAVSFWLLLIVGWMAAGWLRFRGRDRRRPAPEPRAEAPAAAEASDGMAVESAATTPEEAPDGLAPA